jgi:serine/threonine protein kinase
MKLSPSWARAAWARCIARANTRLDRTVAIKVLAAELAATPELHQRLEREARSVAALNHPHICTLDDVGQQDDPSGLELVRGAETNRDELTLSTGFVLRSRVMSGLAIAAASPPVEKNDH